MIIVLKPNTTESEVEHVLDRIRGLEQGADDYLVKPFGYGELRCRIASLLRRAQDRGPRGSVRVGRHRPR